MKKLTQGFCSQRASEAAVCRFHLLSHNVGVVKPFENATVIKGYANKPDLKRKDEFKGPGVLFTVLAFLSVKLCQDNSWELCIKSIFMQREKNILTYVFALSSLFFFSSALSFCHMLSSPSAATAAPSTSLKSHCCILNYLRLITFPLQGDERLLENEPTWGNY